MKKVLFALIALIAVNAVAADFYEIDEVEVKIKISGFYAEAQPGSDGSWTVTAKVKTNIAAMDGEDRRASSVVVYPMGSRVTVEAIEIAPVLGVDVNEAGWFDLTYAKPYNEIKDAVKRIAILKFFGQLPEQD